MISAELEAKIRRLFHAEKWPIGTIGRHLALHHSTVRRTLRRDGVPLTAMLTRKSKIDPFVPFILETLEAFPDLAASVLFGMVKGRGYDGGPDHFRAIIGRYRPKKAAEAYLRLSVLPGEQAQVDWGHRAIGVLPDDDVTFFGAQHVHGLGAVGRDAKFGARSVDGFPNL